MLTAEGKLINPEVRIELTNRCNCHCITCPRDGLTRPLADMDLGLFVDILEQAKDLGATLISLFGFGESLLHPKISLFSSFVTEYGFKSFLTTNGSKLGVELGFRLLESGLSDIRFSVHGLWRNYDRFHQGLCFEDTIRNISNFIQYRNKNGYTTRIHVISMPIMDDTVQDIRDFWEHNVDFLEIWKPHNWGGAKRFRQQTVERKASCNRPFSGPVQVQVDGSIIPCCFLTNSELVMGSINGVGIRDILEGDDYQDLMERHRIGDFSGIVCERCDQLNIEEESPLLWSNRDPECRAGRLSSSKFELV